ncbi:endonuclease VII domain-containing protein [Arthrobacter sp. YA7-1]|uniref:endonuclease VII domain-containing protein n=1 Tax=Arthrobacter sp. YA7-1 TaxID=2987701 RepID=UPI002227D196|nr:endonuclease VII domain-containing protein [Arthrobacter sp. YA7-1]UYY83057.1 endonuclease VII domain-containing protein [Arthrobacter sp. YA7-1]
MRAPGQVFIEGKKPCSVCRKILDVSAFGKSSSAPTGLAHACKACVKEKRDKKHVAVPRTTAILVVDGMKPCHTCKRLLPVSEFHKHAMTVSGLASNCKECVAEAFQKRYVPTPRTTAILVIDGMKPCSTCKELLPVSEFGKDSNTVTGLRHSCRRCSNAETRSRRNNEKAKDPEAYLARERASAQRWRASAPPELRKTRGRKQLFTERGVTAEWYDETLAEQGGVCAICKQPESKLSSGGGPKMLAFDHDHTTGKARGLICQQCNIGIGAFRDSPDLLRKAALYLVERKWESIGQSFEDR